MPAPICGNCRWYVDRWNYDKRETVCTRFPPTVVQSSAYARTIWPQPEERDLCGEHKPKEKTDAIR